MDEKEPTLKLTIAGRDNILAVMSKIGEIARQLAPSPAESIVFTFGSEHAAERFIAENPDFAGTVAVDDLERPNVDASNPNAVTAFAPDKADALKLALTKTEDALSAQQIDGIKQSIESRLAALEQNLELIAHHRHKLRGEFSMLADRIGAPAGDGLEAKALERLDLLECVEPLLGKCIDGVEILLREATLKPPLVAAPSGKVMRPLQPGGMTWMAPEAPPAHIDIIDQHGELRRLDMGPEGYYRIPADADWWAAEFEGTEKRKGGFDSDDAAQADLENYVDEMKKPEGDANA